MITKKILGVEQANGRMWFFQQQRKNAPTLLHPLGKMSVSVYTRATVLLGKAVRGWIMRNCAQIGKGRTLAGWRAH
jgi:hypothetical protein